RSVAPSVRCHIRSDRYASTGTDVAVTPGDVLRGAISGQCSETAASRLASRAATGRERVMTSPYQTLIYEERDRIARVQFNREKDTNAFSRQMTLELIDVCGRMRADAALPQPPL